MIQLQSIQKYFFVRYIFSYWHFESSNKNKYIKKCYIAQLLVQEHKYTHTLGLFKAVKQTTTKMQIKSNFSDLYLHRSNMKSSKV